MDYQQGMKQGIAHGELMRSIITTKPLNPNWVAHITGDETKSGRGVTESEAIGEVWRSWTEAVIAKCAASKKSTVKER